MAYTRRLTFCIRVDIHCDMGKQETQRLDALMETLGALGGAADAVSRTLDRCEAAQVLPPAALDALKTRRTVLTLELRRAEMLIHDIEAEELESQRAAAFDDLIDAKMDAADDAERAS